MDALIQLVDYLQDSRGAVVMYHTVIATTVVVATTIVLAAVSILIIEFIPDHVRRLKALLFGA